MFYLSSDLNLHHLLLERKRLTIRPLFNNITKMILFEIMRDSKRSLVLSCFSLRYILQVCLRNFIHIRSGPFDETCYSLRMVVPFGPLTVVILLTTGHNYLDSPLPKVIIEGRRMVILMNMLVCHTYWIPILFVLFWEVWEELLVVYTVIESKSMVTIEHRIRSLNFLCVVRMEDINVYEKQQITTSKNDSKIVSIIGHPVNLYLWTLCIYEH